MKLEEIQDLIKFVAKSGATEVDLEFEGVKLSIKSPAKKRRGEIDPPTTIIQQSASTCYSYYITNSCDSIANTTHRSSHKY